MSTMRLFDAGSGPPLVVVPGVQGRWEWIRPALDHLARRCRTISYTLAGDLGSGRRADPSAGFDTYLEQLDAVFERARLGRAAICGSSFGGFIALRYAATRPDRVSGLIIVSSPSPGWTPSPTQSRYIASPWRRAPSFVLTSPARIWPEICRTFEKPHDRFAFLARHSLRVIAAPMIPALMARRVRQQQALDFGPDCTRIRAGTLIVTGEQGLDQIVPVESTLRYLSMIPGSRHRLIENTGHLGLITRPELFASIVGDFVKDVQGC